MSSELTILADLLRSHGHSVTITRKKVFNALLQKYPQSMAQVIDLLPSVERASVYRSVALFEAIGAINRIQIGWKYKLELSDKFSHHHHHIVCSSCGYISELPESLEIERVLNKLASQTDYLPQSHQIELTGLCKSCKT